MVEPQEKNNFNIVHPELTSSPFLDKDNWEAYDAGNTGGLSTKGYFGAVSDGRYIYYIPNRQRNFHGIALRYDTSQEFNSKIAWEAYDAGNTDGLKTIGYADGVFDGRYIYYVPFANGNSQRHANILRFDTQGDFKDKDSWKVYDAVNTDGLYTTGFYGGGFDGQYVYFVPYDDGREVGVESEHGRVLRYNTEKEFKSKDSWEAFDINGIGGGDNRGYVGAVFDGDYIYVIPYAYDKSVYHGNFIRYDIKKEFKSKDSWEVHNLGTIDGNKIEGYKYGVYEKGYIYFCPYGKNKGSFQGIALRYKTK